MRYLFVAFSIVWLGIFLYNFYLTRRVERLEGDLRMLRLFISDKDEEGK